jgi:hypothetical protein
MIIMVFDNKSKHFNEQTRKVLVRNFPSYHQIDFVFIFFTEQQSSLTPVDVLNHLPIYDIEIDSIGTNQMNTRYLLIEGKFNRIG